MDNIARLINRISLIIGLLAIIIATAISILAIWSVINDTNTIARALATLGVIFTASVLTVFLNWMAADRPNPERPEQR